MKHSILPTSVTAFSSVVLPLALLVGCGTTAPGMMSKKEIALTDPAEMFQFVQVPKGCYQMGALTASTPPPGRTPTGPSINELPRHKVCVDSFYIGTHEVTRKQWQRIMGGPPVPTEVQLMPQSHISWSDARRFLMRLNQYSSQIQYRLPTEAEWEYACLAGTYESQLQPNTVQYARTLQQHAWYMEPFRTEAKSRPVGELKPNAWGLYDMLGNLSEWTSDSYRHDAYQHHQQHNPHVSDKSERYVIRGGSYNSHGYQVRCGSRSYGIDNDPLPTQGLRLVKVPTATTKQVSH